MTAAEAAARWWADRLRDGAGVGDNGARDPQNAIAATAGRMLWKQPANITVDMFRSLLTALIERSIAKLPIGVSVELATDYQPCMTLLWCLTEAGISRDMVDYSLPAKALMDISRDRVVVTMYYSSPMRSEFQVYP